jgi:hypothetical protein
METLLRSAKCTNINPLYKLRPIGGNPLTSFFSRNQIPGMSCSMVVAIEAIKDSARKIKNQQMG